MTMRRLGNEKGVSLIMAVATLLILSLMAVVLVSLVGTETFSALNQSQSLQTFDLAEAGAHRAIRYLGFEEGDCTDIESQFTNVAMGRGTFTVIGDWFSASTTLSAGITDSQKTIPVGDTEGFALHGRIHIRQPAPEVDAVKTGSGTTASITVPNFTVSGTDRLLVVAISQGNVNFPVTSVTYGASSLGALGTESAGPPGPRIEMWRLLAPPEGTANVVVDFSLPPSDGAVIGVMSLTNVNQTTPLRPFVSNAGNGGASVNVTSEVGELVIDILAKGTPVAATVKSGQTQKWNEAFSNSAYGALSTRPGAKTVTMAWWSADDWAIGAVSVKPLDPEPTNYTGKTANSFTGALRPTTAISHLTGAVVTQDQCRITSTGTIPGPSGPAQRKVEVTVEYP